MIIFDLDGTLANCQHRKHFVDPRLNLENANEWKKDWRKFFEACDKDIPIDPVLEILCTLLFSGKEVQIWTGRSEFVRDKTVNWIKQNLESYYKMRSWPLESYNLKVKMREIGGPIPQEVIKEKWFDQAIADGKIVEYVIDKNPKVVKMWRRRGVFVVDVNQSALKF